MRMRTLVSALYALLGCSFAFVGFGLPAGAQTTAPNEWTWMGGGGTFTCQPNSVFCGLPGVYGTLGTPAAGNIPGTRDSTSTWTDRSGDLWLFGGDGSDASGNLGVLNDLWKFDPATSQWTWMGGSSTVPVSCLDNPGGECSQPGVYGTLGIPGGGNIPGGRGGAVNWTDNNGNFWLLGGWGRDSADSSVDLDDLWEFNPSTNEWTWMGGSSTINSFSEPGAVYGNLGIPAPGNYPGPQSNAASWTDHSGNLWLFGNGFWEFYPSSNEWAWMGGNNPALCPQGNPACGQYGVYGTLGVPAAGNIPPQRSLPVSWTDSDGNFWLFRGYYLFQTVVGRNEETVSVYLNDLWEFNPSTSEWAWMAGSNAPIHSSVSSPFAGQPGVYGTLGMPAAGNTPGGRYGASSWTDGSGNLWLFGGWGLDADGNLYSFPNDLWDFNPSTNEWTWMGGSPVGSQSNVYGILGTPAAGNVPGSRIDAASWTDGGGSIWLFGGEAIDFYGVEGYLNDLWQYQPSATTLPPAATPVFSIASGIYAPGSSVTISNGMANASFYYTTDGTTPTTGSILYKGPVTISSSETIQAIATAPGYPNSGVASAAYVTAQQAATPAFSVTGGTYATNQSVTITDGSAGATIYYTTDGTMPTASSTVYSGPIQVMATGTIEAIATASGYSTSAVATATYTIPQSFNLSIDPASMTVTAGASGTSQIKVQDEGGFPGIVSFACSGLPLWATCSFSTLTNPTPAGVSYSTLTVTTYSTTAEMRRNSGPLFPGAAVAVVVFCFGLRKRRRLLMLVVLAVGLGGLGLMGGCGGGGGRKPVTSTVTVTGAAWGLQQTATLTLTVN